MWQYISKIIPESLFSFTNETEHGKNDAKEEENKSEMFGSEDVVLDTAIVKKVVNENEEQAQTHTGAVSSSKENNPRNPNKEIAVEFVDNILSQAVLHSTQNTILQHDQNEKEEDDEHIFLQQSRKNIKLKSHILESIYLSNLAVQSVTISSRKRSNSF